jgi:hypothetical protein
MSGPLSLSPDAVPVLTHFGAERGELVTIDKALPDPAAVVAIAARHSYRPIGPFYPGLRAPVSEAVAMPLIAPIGEYLRSTFKLDGPPRYFECYLSLVTAAPADLAPIQRLPHFDGVEPDRLAVLLYLDACERGGTAFYRQRATGFESVDESRYAAYRSALDAGVAEHGLPPPAYISGNTPLFERVQAVEGRFNRLIAYRGNTLHCADLNPGFAPVSDPATGRLTLNLFLRAAAPY